MKDRLDKIKDWFRKRWIGVVALAVTITVSLLTPVEQVEVSGWDNLLINPGFEAGCTNDASRTWWWNDNGPYNNAFGEVCVPDGWDAWWRQDTPCVAYTFDKGRPEVQVIGASDPERVHDGSQALKMFTFFRCHEMGVFQQVDVEPGWYRFSIYAHAWYSSCSKLPHSMPYNKDCEKILWDSWDRMKVGIGGSDIDPRSSEIVWSGEVEQYGVYGPELSVMAEVVSPTITVWFVSECNFPLRHNDVHADSAMLVRIYPVYLPIIIKE